MTTIKKIIIAVAVFIVTSSIGGYLYFETKFTPVENTLIVSYAGDTIPITWVENELSPRAALLLPVKIAGIETQFYMQFDSGSANTIFYKIPLKSITDKFKGRIESLANQSATIDLTFNLGKISIASKNFKVIDHGEKLNFHDENSIKIIGTIGTDFLERKKAILNFKENYCFFGDTFPNTNTGTELVNFEFKKRKIIIPSKIDGENYNLLYDTGTSAFELVTSEKIWNNLSKKDEKVSVQKANSLGNILKTYTTKSNKNIQFENTKIALTEVTYIEGTTLIQNLLMKSSGMGGMIGNKIFRTKILLLDCKNQKFGILENLE